MKKVLFFLILTTFGLSLRSQINPGIYISDLENVRHELKLSDSYFVHTVYEESPARFIKSIGGFYSVKDNVLNVTLEFNSNYETDAIEELSVPFSNRDNQLVLETTPKLTFDLVKGQEQHLDGQWLFATRGPDTGQERRGEDSTRKTLKFLLDGRFQWIAYDTAGMQFKGTGGGSYTAKDGVYTENIEFFSRDDSRVGASLEFNFEVKGNDWHHTGKNSKGEPMYEIWARRK